MPKEQKEEQKVEQTNKTSFALFVVLVVVLFVVAAYLLVWPAYGHLSDNKNKLTTQKNLLQTQTDYLSNLQKLISNYEAIKVADKEKLAQMLPKEIDEPGLFVLFETLAEKNKMVVLAIDISEKEPGAEIKALGLREVHIAVNLAGGDYESFKNLLDDLESNLRLMDIISISYTPEPPSYSLNIRTYRLEI